MMYGQGPQYDHFGYGMGHGYCGCKDEPFYGFTGGYPVYRGNFGFALVLVLFILLVIIGATRF